MANPADLTATGLLEAFASRALSPVEVTCAVIARIERAEPKLNGLYAFDPDAALSAAHTSEQRWIDRTARARGSTCYHQGEHPVQGRRHAAWDCGHRSSAGD